MASDRFKTLFCSLQVIRALDPKLNPATAEIQALKSQLSDRDKQILNLEVCFPSVTLFLEKHDVKIVNFVCICLCSASVSRPD